MLAVPECESGYGSGHGGCSAERPQSDYPDWHSPSARRPFGFAGGKTTRDRGAPQGATGKEEWKETKTRAGCGRENESGYLFFPLIPAQAGTQVLRRSATAPPTPAPAGARWQWARAP